MISTTKTFAILATCAALSAAFAINKADALDNQNCGASDTAGGCGAPGSPTSSGPPANSGGPPPDPVILPGDSPGDSTAHDPNKGAQQPDPAASKSLIKFDNEKPTPSTPKPTPKNVLQSPPPSRNRITKVTNPTVHLPPPPNHITNTQVQRQYSGFHQPNK
jgi:hypothetical protein